MCYSFTTSIISYSLGIISAIFAIATKQYMLGLLILFYCQMQLSEALIWYGIDTKNDELNKIGTSFGKYLLATHNIGLSFGIILCYLDKQDKVDWQHFIPLFVSLLFFIIVVIVYYLPNNYPSLTRQLDPTCATETNKCQNPNNRLNWSYPHQWYIVSFIISLLLLYIYVKPAKNVIFLYIMFIGSFLIAKIFFNNVIGSFWCFSTAILAPILVGVNYYFIKNLQPTEFFT